MKALKIISILSFLFTMGLHQHTSYILIILLLNIYSFIESVTVFSSILNWDGFLFSVLTILTFIIFIKCRGFQERYLQLFCFFALIVAGLLLTGTENSENFKRIDIYFLLPFSFFIISSIIIILANFRLILIRMKKN